MNCDASDHTELTTISGRDNAIKHDDAFNAGWKLIGPACGTGTSSICICSAPVENGQTPF